MPCQSRNGFSLIEVMFALAVLLVGVLGAAAVIATGTRLLRSSPGDVISAQKAAQAIETVFAARDSNKVKWEQLRNMKGVNGDGGVFIDGPTPLRLAGADGLVNTADDEKQPIESTTFPGKDQRLDTKDDETTVLTGYTREIAIRDLPNENGNLRSVTATITYQVGTDIQSYVLTTYISRSF